MSIALFFKNDDLNIFAKGYPFSLLPFSGERKKLALNGLQG